MATFIDVFGLAMVVTVAYQIVSRLPAGAGARVAHVVVGLIGLYGCVGFVAQFAAGAGGLRFIPSSFEWPVLRPETMAVDSEGRTIVGLASTGRVQVYDPQGRFVTGWFVEAGGGSFKLQVTSSDQIEVFTARGERRLVYDASGTLVDKGTFAPTAYEAVVTHPSTGREVRSTWPLWPLASSLVAWSLFAFGMLGSILPELLARRSSGRF
ncbi:MAG TPA: hypothetical protein VJN96_09700 [Vicinamibacterales bacterium]|nr:hypothetical protein [Vicinamibacterales bacterium]